MGEMIRLKMAAGEIVAQTFEDIAKLHAKIAAASASVARVEKDAKNTFHKYEYTSYGALAAAANHALVEHGLAFGVGIERMDQEQPADGKMLLATAHIEATITDTETGATRIYRWVGMGADSQDKGPAKALTSGVKYGLMRTLLVSDQEGDADGDGDGQQKPPSQRQRKPVHWIDAVDTQGRPVRNRFWAWARDDMALSTEQDLI